MSILAPFVTVSHTKIYLNYMWYLKNVKWLRYSNISIRTNPYFQSVQYTIYHVIQESWHPLLARSVYAKIPSVQLQTNILSWSCMKITSLKHHENQKISFTLISFMAFYIPGQSEDMKVNYFSQGQSFSSDAGNQTQDLLIQSLIYLLTY